MPGTNLFRNRASVFREIVEEREKKIPRQSWFKVIIQKSWNSDRKEVQDDKRRGFKGLQGLCSGRLIRAYVRDYVRKCR